MSDTNQLKALLRDRVGKGAARALRRENMVPAVIYGDKKPPIAIGLPAKEVTTKIHGGGFMTNILEIDIDGDTHNVLPKDYQLHPVSDRVMHIDLLRVSRRTIVTVEVPVHFENEDTCPGLKAGGVLNIVRHTVEVNCPANSIPERFSIDLAPFELGDTIHVSTITLPDDVTPTITDRDFTIATIATPAGLRSDDAADDGDVEEAPETEVINQKSEDEE